MGGVVDVIKLLEGRGQKIQPQIFKHLNNNKYEQQMFEEIPELKRYDFNEEVKESGQNYYVRDIKEADVFAF